MRVTQIWRIGPKCHFFWLNFVRTRVRVRILHSAISSTNKHPKVSSKSNNAFLQKSCLQISNIRQRTERTIMVQCSNHYSNVSLQLSANNITKDCVMCVCSLNDNYRFKMHVESANFEFANFKFSTSRLTKSRHSLIMCPQKCGGSSRSAIKGERNSEEIRAVYCRGPSTSDSQWVRIMTCNQHIMVLYRVQSQHAIISDRTIPAYPHQCLRFSSPYFGSISTLLTSARCLH